MCGHVLRNGNESVILSDASPILARSSVLAERMPVRVQTRRSEAPPPRTRRKAGFVYPQTNSVTMTDALRNAGRNITMPTWPSSHWTRGLDLAFPRRCIPEYSEPILSVRRVAVLKPRSADLQRGQSEGRNTTEHHGCTARPYGMDGMTGYTRLTRRDPPTTRVLAFGPPLAPARLLTGYGRVTSVHRTPKRKIKIAPFVLTT